MNHIVSKLRKMNIKPSSQNLPGEDHMVFAMIDGAGFTVFVLEVDEEDDSYGFGYVVNQNDPDMSELGVLTFVDYAHCGMKVVEGFKPTTLGKAVSAWERENHILVPLPRRGQGTFGYEKIQSKDMMVKVCDGDSRAMMLSYIL